MIDRAERDDYSRSLIKAEWVINSVANRNVTGDVADILVPIARALLEGNRLLLQEIAEAADPPENFGDIDDEWRRLSGEAA